jgi:hypothetical protein
VRNPPQRRKRQDVFWYVELATKVCLLAVAALEVLKAILLLTR